MTEKLCKCGCGKPVTKPGNRFISGHNSRGNNYWDHEPEPTLCKCGCGELAKPGNEFIFNHQKRGEEYWKLQEESKLCECGCGNYAKSGNRFIDGHNRRGIEHTEETCEKMSIFQTKRFENPEECEKDRLAQLKRYEDPLEHIKTSKGGKKRFENQEEHERQSARLQGIPYDEWTGYTDKRRPHLVPKGKCILLNKRFLNSAAHHITESIIIYIPIELHKHIYHNLKRGTNMSEINMLALQFINGCYDE